MEKPIILLDVDGVLNPDFPKLNRDWIFEFTFISSPESGSVPLDLSKEMGNTLDNLNCEIRWLTTWIAVEDFANPEIGRHFNWAYKEVCDLRVEPISHHWKLDYVIDLLKNPGSKVIWIDDEIYTKFLTPGDELLIDPHKRLLIISPDNSIGLTKADILKIQEFINANTSN